MSTTDRILDIIDAGLQSSDEHGYGTDLLLDRCARCQRHESDLGDLCTGCRAFLLEDSDEDPRTVPATGRPADDGTRSLEQQQELIRRFSRPARGERAVMAIFVEGGLLPVHR